MNLTEAVKIIRKELLIKDEPLKAYRLLKELDIPELKKELDNSYGLVRHIFEPNIYQKNYGMLGEDQIPDCEKIEPRSIIKDASSRYDRYAWIVAEFKSEKPQTYLDLACYVGSLVTTASSLGIKATGVDMTKRAIEVARERALSEKLDCTFICDDALTFKSEPFDMVSAFEVIEHVPDPVNFIQHISNLSKGWVYITTPCGAYGDGEPNMGRWEWDGVELHVRGHVRVFTKASLFKLIDECGCDIGFLESMRDGLLWCKFRRKESK